MVFVKTASQDAATCRTEFERIVKPMRKPFALKVAFNWNPTFGITQQRHIFMEIKITPQECKVAQAKPFLLFSLWFLLVILPFVVLSYVLDIMLKESEERMLERAKIQLIEEVGNFQKDLNSSFFKYLQAGLFMAAGRKSVGIRRQNRLCVERLHAVETGGRTRLSVV